MGEEAGALPVISVLLGVCSSCLQGGGTKFGLQFGP